MEFGSDRVHLQKWGAGPTLLFLHGVGASGQSWHPVMDILAEDFTVCCVDIPGHAFSRSPGMRAPNIGAVARRISDALSSAGVDERFLIGHSAGGAIAAYMTAHRLSSPRGVITFNGAFYPFAGAAGVLFPTFAKLLTLNPFAPSFFSISAGSRKRIERLIRQTGSTVDPATVDSYQTLMESSGHIDGALKMMANWDLGGIEALLRKTDVPMLFVSSVGDKAVPPSDSTKAANAAPFGISKSIDALGHLAHEESPSLAADLIRDFIRKNG